MRYLLAGLLCAALHAQNPYPGDLAPLAYADASTESEVTGQFAQKAVDGVNDGYPGVYSHEWATKGELGGAWIRLRFYEPVVLTRVVIHDRPNSTDNVLAGTLQFMADTGTPLGWLPDLTNPLPPLDGSQLGFGPLPNDGTGLTLNFSPRTVRQIAIRIDNATGASTGLAEIEAYGSLGVTTANQNFAPSVYSVEVSSQNTATDQLGIKAVDGFKDGYPGDYTREWATVGQTTNARITLLWARGMPVSRIVLYDRPNLDDHILGGVLQINNTYIPVGPLPNDGSPLVIDIVPATLSTLTFVVTDAAGYDVGLSEIETSFQNQ
jgi:hypothetical protein